MKNVKLLVKLRRLLKSLTVSFIIINVGIAATAFKADATDNDNKQASEQKDKSGFKSLFSASTFDPTKPYVTQLNPKAVPFVQAYIEERGADLERMKIWGKPYFDMYDGILAKNGLPKELKYLSVIESQLVSNIVSVAGAKGPWQIMASEARRVGLKVGGKIDERTNYYKSTQAASKILKELHSQFNDWLLVIAAYNCGAGRMRQAIRKSGSKNFWDLQAYLPLETRNHVKKFIGTHYIFEGSGGLTTMTASEVHDYHANVLAQKAAKVADNQNENITAISVSGKYNATIIAQRIGLDVALFNKLNPDFDKLVSMGNQYNLRIPNEKVNVFNKERNNILNESLQLLINGNTTGGK